MSANYIFFWQPRELGACNNLYYFEILKSHLFNTISGGWYDKNLISQSQFLNWQPAAGHRELQVNYNAVTLRPLVRIQYTDTHPIFSQLFSFNRLCFHEYLPTRAYEHIFLCFWLFSHAPAETHTLFVRIALHLAEHAAALKKFECMVNTNLTSKTILFTSTHHVTCSCWRSVCISMHFVTC